MKKAEAQLRPIDIKVENLGKLINSSKRKYTWKFNRNEEIHQFSLTLSIMSNKYKISYNEKEVDRGTLPFFQTFEYQTVLHDLSFLVEQQKTNMKLYINEQLFEIGSMIDVWINKATRNEKSMSVNKLTPKKSQVSRVMEKRNKEVGFEGASFRHIKMPPPANFMRAPESHKVFLKTGDIFRENETKHFENEKMRLGWTNLDDFELKPDSFFEMNFNHETELMKILMKKIYS